MDLFWTKKGAPMKYYTMIEDHSLEMDFSKSLNQMSIHSKENIEIIKTVYFETTGKDVDKIIETINLRLEERLLLYNHLQAAFIEYAETCGTECITEEQYTVLEAHTLLWNNDDKLIYALATFLEYEKMTIDEISEFLLNNPEIWKDIEQRLWNKWT